MIKKLNKILVLLDGSQNSFRALDEAITLAKAYHAEITGLNVVSFYTMGFQPFTSITIHSPIEKILETESLKFMKQAELRCTINNISFFSRIIHGPEGPTIVSFIKKNKFDLIVIGSRGRSTPREIFLGSVSNYVLHKITIPILIVK